MSYNYQTLSEAFEMGVVKFQGQQISSNYDEVDQSRISGKFVIAVIALIVLEFLVYQIFPFNQTYAIFMTIVIIWIGYFFMNRYLKSYKDVGVILFNNNYLEFSNKEYNRKNQIDYTDILLIKANPGIPYQVFRGTHQQKEFVTLKITFILSDKQEVNVEVNVKLLLIELDSNLMIRHVPHLEAILKELYGNYEIIDKKAYKNQIYWGF